MVMGSPLHNPSTEPKRWSDKMLMHAGTIDKFNAHAMNYNLAIVAKHIRPSWGVAVIDGFEGGEPGDHGDPGARCRLHAVRGAVGIGPVRPREDRHSREKPEAVKKTFKLHTTANYQLG